MADVGQNLESLPTHSGRFSTSKAGFWQRLRGGVHKQLVVDTLTTRFLMLFLFLLSIPLLSTIFFTVSLLNNEMSSNNHDQIVFSRNLFNSSVDEARDRLEHARYLSSMPDSLPSDVLPALRYSFTISGGKLFLESIDLSGRHASKTPGHGRVDTHGQAARTLVIDDTFLNRLYRRQPNLQTEIWILSQDESLQKSRLLARSPHANSKIDLRRLRLSLPSINQSSLYPVSQLEINRLPYLVSQQFMYSRNHQKVARVLHILPLRRNQQTLDMYYLGIYSISVASLIFSVLLAMLAGRTITQPLLQLIRKVEALSRETAIRVSDEAPVRGVYEIRRLAETFNRMVRRLHQEHTLRDEFVATLTHDLKVPLLAEKQTLAYLNQRTYGELTDDQAEVVELLQSSNGSCLSLVNGMLEVYRYDSGAVRLLRESFNPWTLLDEVVRSLQPLAHEKNLTLTLGIEPNAGQSSVSEPGHRDDEKSTDQPGDKQRGDALRIFADPLEIKRVLINLISNAITNTSAFGHIHCQVYDLPALERKTVYRVSEFTMSTLHHSLRSDNRLLISIRDSGVGFMREDLPNLFKRFAASRGRNPMSIGLGLYNCYQVVQANGGILWVETTEGEGSAVNFMLPIEPEIQDRRKIDDRRHSSVG